MDISISPSSLLITGLLTVILIFLSSSAAPAAATGVCTDELVSFSACLSYTAEPPNNSSSSASTDCCDIYSNIVINGNEFCLCYLLEEPRMLGFPLSTSRILALSSVCPPRQRNATSQRILSLQPFCSAFEAPPPAQSPDQRHRNHSNSSELATGPATPPITMDSTPISAGRSPPDLDPASLQVSSATRIRSIYTWFYARDFLLVWSSAPQRSYILEFFT